MNITAFLKKWVPIVTPAWLPAANAHIFWAAFWTALVRFQAPHWLVPVIVLQVLIYGAKEFYVDKHFETTPQTFLMNLTDFGEYVAGMLAAVIL